MKSLERYQQNHSKLQKKSEKLLKSSNVGRGYLTVNLCKNGEVTRFYIHQLVAQYFLENFNNLPTVNHKDGNKHNNYYKNLEWATYSENNQHAYDNDLHGKGIDHYIAILNEEQVKEIIINGKGNNTYQEIADKYGVSKATIRDVLIRRTWKHIHTQLENSNDYPVRE